MCVHFHRQQALLKIFVGNIFKKDVTHVSNYYFGSRKHILHISFEFSFYSLSCLSLCSRNW